MSRIVMCFVMRAIIVEIFFLKKISVLADDQIIGRYFNPMIMLHDPLAISMSEKSLRQESGWQVPEVTGLMREVVNIPPVTSNNHTLQHISFKMFCYG
jgi:hypothetical protein